MLAEVLAEVGDLRDILSSFANKVFILQRRVQEVVGRFLAGWGQGSRLYTRLHSLEVKQLEVAVRQLSKANALTNFSDCSIAYLNFHSNTL
jgi:hypothetical protein